MAGLPTGALKAFLTALAAIVLAVEANDAESLAAYHKELLGVGMNVLSRDGFGDSMFDARELADADDEDDNTSSAATEILPPVVEFIGRAPKLRIYPGGASGGNDTWIMLSFGSINEVDPSGKRVNGRSIMSLASAPVEWSQTNETIGGASAIVTTMTLNMEWGGSFKEQCSGKRRLKGNGNDKTTGGGGGGNDKTTGGGGNDKDTGKPNDDADTTDDTSSTSDGPGSVIIKIFVFADEATIDYGNYSIDVFRGQMKFNIESGGWPFCSEDNFLEMNLDIKNKGSGGPSMKDKPAKATKSGKGGGRAPNLMQFTADAGGRGCMIDLPTVAVLDDEAQDIEVDLDAKGGKTTILFRFPYFSDSLVYDPNVGFEGLIDDGSDSTSSDGTDTDMDTDADTEVGESDSTTGKGDGSDDSSSTGEEETAGSDGTDGSDKSDDSGDESTEDSTSAAPAEKPKVIVSGTATLSVPDAAAFCANAQALDAIANVLAEQTGTSLDDVSLGCEAEGGRRLSNTGMERRLQESAIISYEITIESDSVDSDSIAADSPAVLAVQEAIASLDAESLQTLIQAELESLGLDIEVAVLEISEVATEVVVPTTTTTLASSASPDEPDFGTRSGVASGVLVTLVSAAVGHVLFSHV